MSDTLSESDRCSCVKIKWNNWALQIYTKSFQIPSVTEVCNFSLDCFTTCLLLFHNLSSSEFFTYPSTARYTGAPHIWLRNQFPPFFSSSLPTGTWQIQACPFPDVVFQPLPLCTIWIPYLYYKHGWKLEDLKIWKVLGLLGPKWDAGIKFPVHWRAKETFRLWLLLTLKVEQKT